MKRAISIINGQFGGRPPADSNSNFVLNNFDSVILTENQYNKLLERYGNKLLTNALAILQIWLNTSPIGIKYKGKNNYAHFRSDGWLINEAKNSI